MGGHGSHKTEEFIDFCWANKINKVYKTGLNRSNLEINVVVDSSKVSIPEHLLDPEHENDDL